MKSVNRVVAHESRFKAETGQSKILSENAFKSSFVEKRLVNSFYDRGLLFLRLKQEASI